MTEQDLPPEHSPFDARLWVRDAHGHIGYLGAKSYTFPERFLTWWAYLGSAYSTSLHELSECSASSELWLRGFLRGSAPDAWFEDDDFEYEESDARTHRWREAVEGYQLTGTWAPGRRCEVCDAEILPSAPAGPPYCPRHGGEIRSSWPSVHEEAAAGRAPET